MDYATQHHIGKSKNSRRTKTKTTAPAIGRIFRMDKTTERRFRNTEGQTEIRPCKPTPNGFLTSLFLPKLKENDLSKQSQNQEIKTERDFYQSLFRLAEHYHIEPTATRHFGYPYNIALALDDVQNQLKNKVENWEKTRLIRDKGKTYFTSEERYDTGSTLYYIPIVPLYRLSKNPKRKHATELLKSVCSYLYHIAGVPYYRNQSSYLYWIYEMVAEWIISDDENEDTPIYLSEIKQAEQVGDMMEKKIFSSHHLSRFKKRLDSFKSNDVFDNDCFLLASKVFELYGQYPDESIYRNLQTNRESDDDGDMVISMDKYISFCADAKGILFQTLFETVNAEFQECSTMQEPIIVKKFDGPDITNNNLDFESRLFPLIEELIYILDNF